MTIAALAAAGMPIGQANMLTGTKSIVQTSAGTGQSDAAALLADCVLLTTVAASSGVILPATMNIHSSRFIANGGANALAIYPPTGGKINNASANAAYSLAAGKGAIIIRVDATNFICVAA